VIDSIAGNALGYQDMGLTAGTDYTYQVRACNTGGCSANATAMATTLPPTPSPAQMLQAAAIPSGNQIDLVWQAPATGPVTTYRVERESETVPGQWDLLATVPAGVLSYQDFTVTANSTYSYRVIACNGASCAPPSNVATAQAVSPSLPAPPVLTAKAAAANQVDLSWTNDPTVPVRYFEIERSTGSSQNFALIHTTASGSQLVYADTGLIGGMQYHYRMRACTAVACSSHSPIATATTLPPATPAGLTASSTSPTAVTLSWQPPGGQTYYQIERRNASPPIMSRSYTVSNPDATSYVDTTVVQGQAYEYALRACSPTVCSAWSAIVTITP
jgi:fibronectin type 3 domain-containing protein